MMTNKRIVAVLICAIFIGLCIASDALSAAFAIKGTVISGPPSASQPIAGALVTLYQAKIETFPLHKVYSAMTNGNGQFSMQFNNLPKYPAKLYLVAKGGNAGAGKNSAISLMAILGNAPFSSNVIQATINEFSTVAAQWEMAQFTDASDPSGQTLSASSTNTAGITNAVNQVVTDLVNPATGAPAAFLPLAAQCPGGSQLVNCDGLERLNTLANILAACVRSSGPSSTPCATLLGTTKTTLQAAHTIATNPTANVSTLFGLQSGSPFAPAVVPPPPPAPPLNDFTVALNFSGLAFYDPVSLALDASGNVWVANNCNGDCNGFVSELTAVGGYDTGRVFAPSAAEFNFPVSIAVDTDGNVYIANFFGSYDCIDEDCYYGSVSELTAASGYATGRNFTSSGADFYDPVSLAVDATGNVWIANEFGNYCDGCSIGSVSELTATSGYATGNNFTTFGANFDDPVSIALDAAGNVWAANSCNAFDCNGSVSELTAPTYSTTGHNYAPPGAVFNGPSSVALDNAEDVWVANYLGDFGGDVSELIAPTYSTTGKNFAASGAGFNGPASVALDSAGNVWTANSNGNDVNYGSVSELTNSSAHLTGFNFAASGAGFDDPVSLAVDASGNVWIANYSGPPNSTDCDPGFSCGSVSEILGLANPVLTPQQACLIKGKNICSP